MGLIVARLAFYMVVIGLCLVGIARNFGLLQPPSDPRINDLQECENDPCVMGVIPGITPWAHTREQLVRGTIEPKRIFVALKPEGEAAFYLSVNKTTVGSIYVRLIDPLPLGWILMRYGYPCGVSIYPQTDQITLRYPLVLANVQLQNSRIRPQTAVISLQYADPALQSTTQPNICVDNLTAGARNRLWKGFAPAWSYLELSN